MPRSLQGFFIHKFFTFSGAEMGAIQTIQPHPIVGCKYFILNSLRIALFPEKPSEQSFKFAQDQAHGNMLDRKVFSISAQVRQLYERNCSQQSR
jgi:hypothetical protein